MCWICDWQNRVTLNESITSGHLYIEIRVLSSKIGGVKKNESGLIFEQTKNPRMEAFGLPIRRPPCGDFLFARKLRLIWFFLTPQSAKLCLIRQGKSAVQKEGKFWNWSYIPDFLHSMGYICTVDVKTIITFGFYQWKRVLASSTIMGLKCKLYLKVCHK